MVCGPAGVGDVRRHADRVPVVALSLRPLGGRFTEALPTGVTDYGAVVLAQPDAFVPPGDPPDAGTPPGATATARLPRRSCCRGRRRPAGDRSGGRLLTDVNPCTRRAR